MKRYIYIIAGLILLYLLLSRQSKLPAVFNWVSANFAKVWNPLTGATNG